MRSVCKVDFILTSVPCRIRADCLTFRRWRRLKTGDTNILKTRSSNIYKFKRLFRENLMISVLEVAKGSQISLKTNNNNTIHLQTRLYVQHSCVTIIRRILYTHKKYYMLPNVYPSQPGPICSY